MFFPIQTDRRTTATPWVNYTLIAINLLVFLFTQRQVEAFSDPALRRQFSLAFISDALPVVQYYLWPATPQLHQFITYQFLHQDLLHVGANMIFLLVLGNNVEDRLGKLGYLCFYLAGGVVAGLGHCLVTNVPVLGASGSVAAVTGAYLVFFPMSTITLSFLFIPRFDFEVTGYVLIIFRIVMDLVLWGMGGGGVAYAAHLAGYGLGFGLAWLLIAVRAVPRETFDLPALIRQRRRRAEFKRLTRQAPSPWSGSAPTSQPTETTEAERAIMARRAEVATLIEQGDYERAARRYAKLIEDHPGQVMPRQQQLDLANQLMNDGSYPTAALAYELFLSTYPQYADRAHVQLILGLIYARYLGETDRARELLGEAVEHLDGDERDLAQRTLTTLPAE